MKYLENQTDKVKQLLKLVKNTSDNKEVSSIASIAYCSCSKPFRSMEPVLINDKSYKVLNIFYLEHKPDKNGTPFYFRLIYRVSGGLKNKILHPDNIPEELLDSIINHLSNH